MYPLGSCTMKYNPRVNELVARTEGLAWAHPYQPEALAQGSHGNHGAAGGGAGGDHRDGCGDAAAGRGSARRADGHPADSRAAPEARQSAQEDPDSGFGARHQSGHGGDCRVRGGEYRLERTRRAGRGRAGAPGHGRRGGPDGDQPEHAGRVREQHHPCGRDSARQGRAALHGRRQHERAGGDRAAGRFRCGRDAPEPAQDVFDAARRRRSGSRTGGGEEGIRAVPAHAAAEAQRQTVGAGITSASTPSGG